MTHPARQPGQSFEDHQREVAAWCGYPDTEALNRDHDALHASLTRWLGIPSHSLAAARGEPHDPLLAGIEEDATLATQRLLAHHGTGVPE